MHPLTPRPGRARIVGALAEGAIIEQGENANGEYVRFANGLQICQHLMLYSGLDTTQTYNTVLITLPAAFVDTNYFTWGVCTGYPGTAGTFITGGGTGISNGQTLLNFYSFSSPPSATTLRFKYIAIGRWKA